MLDNKLIESALQLTDKTMEDMDEITTYEDMNEEQGGYDTIIEASFSIEKFCYYLLSPEFIEKYHDMQYNEPYWIMDDYLQSVRILGEAIYEYQSGNEQPLIELLSNICPTDQTTTLSDQN